MRVEVRRDPGMKPADQELQEPLLASVPMARELGRNWLAGQASRISLEITMWPPDGLMPMPGATVAIHDVEEPERHGKVAAMQFSFGRAAARLALTIHLPKEEA